MFRLDAICVEKNDCCCDRERNEHRIRAFFNTKKEARTFIYNLRSSGYGFIYSKISEQFLVNEDPATAEQCLKRFLLFASFFRSVTEGRLDLNRDIFIDY